MALDANHVRWVAQLARLQLSEAEVQTMARDLSAILDYVHQLNEVDTSQVEPLAHPLELANVFRPDLLVPSIPLEQALANAPERQGPYFAVPAVLE